MPSSRHPYTHSADFIRDIAGPSLSRSDASGIRAALAEEAGVDDLWLASVLSIAFQKKNRSVQDAGCPVIGEIPALSAGPLSEAVEECRGGAGLTGEICARIATTVIEVMEAERPLGPTLTAAQLAHLPDLVAMAMAGYAILKNDAGTPETSSPAVAAFLPLVQEEFDARAAAHEEKMARRYGVEPEF